MRQLIELAKARVEQELGLTATQPAAAAVAPEPRRNVLLAVTRNASQDGAALPERAMPAFLQVPLPRPRKPKHAAGGADEARQPNHRRPSLLRRHRDGTTNSSDESSDESSEPETPAARRASLAEQRRRRPSSRISDNSDEAPSSAAEDQTEDEADFMSLSEDDVARRGRKLPGTKRPRSTIEVEALDERPAKAPRAPRVRRSVDDSAPEVPLRPVRMVV